VFLLVRETIVAECTIVEFVFLQLFLVVHHLSADFAGVIFFAVLSHLFETREIQSARHALERDLIRNRFQMNNLVTRQIGFVLHLSAAVLAIKKCLWCDFLHVCLDRMLSQFVPGLKFPEALDARVRSLCVVERFHVIFEVPFLVETSVAVRTVKLGNLKMIRREVTLQFFPGRKTVSTNLTRVFLFLSVHDVKN
jgi:hypothetical protein